MNNEVEEPTKLESRSYDPPIEELTNDELEKQINNFYDYAPGMSLNCSLDYAATRRALDDILKKKED